MTLIERPLRTFLCNVSIPAWASVVCVISTKAIPLGSPDTAGALCLATKLTARTSATRDVHRGNLVQEGECGRNSIARGRILGERAPSIQTQGSVGRHHQRSETSLVLLETWRKAPSETGLGAEARAKKDSKRKFICEGLEPRIMHDSKEQPGACRH